MRAPSFSTRAKLPQRILSFRLSVFCAVTVAAESKKNSGSGKKPQVMTAAERTEGMKERLDLTVGQLYNEDKFSREKINVRFAGRNN